MLKPAKINGLRAVLKSCKYIVSIALREWKNLLIFSKV